MGFRQITCSAALLVALTLPAPASGQSNGDSGQGEDDTWKTFEVAAGRVRAETVASGLHYPWSLAFLPDGSMLVSEKHPGRLRRVARDGTVSPPIKGLPPIFAEGNGGLLGLAIDPAFTDNNRIYFAYSEPGGGRKAGLSVGRAVLGETELTEVETIFRQGRRRPQLRRPAHLRRRRNAFRDDGRPVRARPGPGSHQHHRKARPH